MFGGTEVFLGVFLFPGLPSGTIVAVIGESASDEEDKHRPHEFQIFYWVTCTNPNSGSNFTDKRGPMASNEPLISFLRKFFLILFLLLCGVLLQLRNLLDIRQ